MTTDPTQPQRPTFYTIPATAPQGGYEIFCTRIAMENTSARPRVAGDQELCSLYLLAARRMSNQQPIALVADVAGLGIPNVGASATDAADAVVRQFGPLVAQVLSCQPADIGWVCVGPDARYDHWKSAGDRAMVQASPIEGTTPGLPPRCREAFDDLYPDLYDLNLRMVWLALHDPVHQMDRTALAPQRPVVH